MFQFREWPEGFEFPACDACNGGTSDDDLLVAWLGRIRMHDDQGNQDNRVPGLMSQINKQHPSLFQKMRFSAAEARSKNRELGKTPAPGQLHQEASGVRVTEEMHRAVCTLARKLSKGIFYNYVGRIFPDDGCLIMNWFSNADLDRDGKYPMFEMLRTFSGEAPALARGGRFLNDQFEFKLTRSPDQAIFVLQAKFGGGFGFVVFGSCKKGLIESMMQRLKERTGREGPFAVLQSPILDC